MQPIYLKITKPDKPLDSGASRFWGDPDLPKDFNFPSYIDENDGEEYNYNFICQINLEELANTGIPTSLPKKGLLSFFAKIDHYLGFFDASIDISGFISDPDAVRVLYFPSCDDLVRNVLVDDEEDPVSPAERQIEFRAEREPLTMEHALFAEPTHREWVTWDPPFEDWQILLQIDSDEDDDFNLNFCDCGVLDFLISPDNLKHNRFDDVRAIVLSS